MSEGRLVVRSAVLWIVGILHFIACTILVAPTLLLHPTRFDRLYRVCARNIIRLAGIRFRVMRGPGFDPARTSIFVANHVDMLDPFFIQCAVPQLVRGLELDAHFRIPFYGWVMKRLGNIGVPQDRSPRKYREMVRQTTRSLDQGISLTVFPEGTRTLTGRVGTFQTGLIRLAIRLGYPIVPVTIAGAFEFSRKGSWLLRPSTVVVHLHDTIETGALGPDDGEELAERLHAIVAAPIEQARLSREPSAGPRG